MTASRRRRAPELPAREAAARSSMLEAFLVTVVRFAGARAGIVRAMAAENDELRLVAAVGLDDEALAREEAIVGPCGICGEALRGAGPRVADPPARCIRFAPEPGAEHAGGGSIAVPLEYKGRTVGVFALFFEGVHDLRGEVIHLLRPVGQLFGLALENARLERENLQASLVHERQAFASEIHDSLAQSLTFVRMRVPLLEHAIMHGEREKALACCRDVDDELASANRRMRELITHFRAGMDAGGLLCALRRIADSFPGRSGIELEYECRVAALPLRAEQEVQVFHIVQEALANVRRHSGARRACLRVARAGAELEIRVSDDGRGIGAAADAARARRAVPRSRSSFGIEIMRERARAIGATVSLAENPRGGTCVTLRLPIGEPESIGVPARATEVSHG